MKIVNALEQPEDMFFKSIFLAGPTYRIDEKTHKKIEWRKEAIELLKKAGFDGIVYEPIYFEDNLPEGWTYEKQVSWEIQMLNRASCILFWIPRDLEELPGFTTNIEFGRFMLSKRVVAGAPDEAPKNEYIQNMCERYGTKWENTLEKCVNNAIDMCKGIKEHEAKVWFTSDTHFDCERTLELSKRPFSDVEEMNNAIVHNWNSVVGAEDTVVHLGDFGNAEFAKILNGQIMLLKGNYDKEDKSFSAWSILENNYPITKGIYLVHEPENAEYDDVFYLFGHIHKLQMVKENGLNVGTDCHNFTPIDMDTVNFYKNAIDNHYDENVFMPVLGE